MFAYGMDARERSLESLSGFRRAYSYLQPEAQGIPCVASEAHYAASTPSDSARRDQPPLPSSSSIRTFAAES
jgi:hypothetical protein